LIVMSLAAGAAAGAQGTASAAVKDAYTGLKSLVKRCLVGRASGETALEQHESRPEAWRSVLEAELVDVEAGQNQSVLRAAQALMELLDSEGSATGNYQVNVRDSQGVQIGDHGIQTNTFGLPPQT